jgi:Dyp-type peroxidase family
MKQPPAPPAPPPNVTASPADFQNPGPVSQSGPGWTRDGSYLVWRRLRQDVPGFRAFVAATATEQGQSTDLIGAKLVGRYASGAPLERTKEQAGGFDPAAADPSIADPTILEEAHINFFEYGEDADGRLVPRAGHIRKAYPRDEATPKGGEVDTQKHRILRRGIAFGLPFRSAARGDGPRTGNPRFPDDRGLLFLCYQQSIAQQFEVVQRFWVNRPDFPEAGDGHDPIIAQADATRTFTLPGGRPDHLELMQRWVITTGGEYFLQPSISALDHLAEGGH